MAEREVITDGGGIEIMIDLGPKTPIRTEEGRQRGGRKRKSELLGRPRMLKEIIIDNNLFFNPQSPSSSSSSSTSSSGGGSHHWLRSNKSKPITCSRPLPPPKVVKKESGVDNSELLNRKKVDNYRPKVVKDLPTPKPVTPCPSPCGKKLYRRKQKWKTDGKKMTISQIENQSQPSCKRVLMFDDNEHMTLEQTDNSNQQEQEVQVLHKRAESFISSMKHIQGDRHFSQWKGSVLDSVVGAFLTQNVDDILSR